MRETLRKKFAGAVAAEALAAKTATAAGRIPTARKLAAAEKADREARDADDALAAMFVSDDAAGDVAGGERQRQAEDEGAAAESKLFADMVFSFYRRRGEYADLHAEEDAAAAETVERRVSSVAEQLPKALAVYLDEMDPVMRRKREAAILAKIGWEDLPLCGASAEEVAAIAQARAAQYAKKHPASDPEFQTAEHRRGRDESIQRRRLRKRARKVRGYIGQAVRGAGGADPETRKNYVTDYSVFCHRDDVRQSHENMERLRILKPAEPKVQIPMLDAHKRKMEREAAKKRLLIDVLLKRAETIGARAVWTTITLPGRFHSNPTNAGHEVEPWDPMLGPDEQMKEMQRRYHQTMNLLRELECRPWGFWAAQAQQDGTVHRHLENFVHDREMPEWEALALLDPEVSESVKTRIREASEERVLQEARMIATKFRERFPGVRGCRAEVVGDTHPDFKPRKDKKGDEETAASIAKYTARYATRLSMGSGDSYEVAGEGGEDDAERPITDLERHAVWASERDARLLNFVGLDSQRSPSRAWDCIWKAVERGEIPDDDRMSLAVQHMTAAQRLIDELIEIRAQQADAEAYAKLLRRPDREIRREIKKLEKQLAESVASSEKNEEFRQKALRQKIARLCDDLARSPEERQERAEQADGDVERLDEDVKALNDDIATYAYQACLAFGFWPDRDLHVSERLWLRAELRLGQQAEIPMPPVPLRAERDNAFGERVKETVGIAAPVVLVAGTAEDRGDAAAAMCEGAMMFTAEDGSWKVVAASPDTTKQILLKVEEWIIVDVKKAAEMVAEAERNAAAEAAADARNRERMKAWQEQCEDLEAEDVYEGDLDSGESVGEDAGAFGCETFRLSLIATDPSYGAGAPQREGEEPPGWRTPTS